jgi:hypothetical protein
MHCLALNLMSGEPHSTTVVTVAADESQLLLVSAPAEHADVFRAHVVTLKL